VHEARGDRARADRLLDQVYAIEREREVLSPSLSPLVARTLILRSDLTVARARLETVLEIEQEQGARPLVLAAMAELLIAEERWGEAPQFAELLRQTEARSGVRMLAPTADRLAGRAALAEKRSSEALALLEAGADGFAALEMAVDAAVVRLDVAEALLALGRRDEARAAAAAAGEVLERVGYVREVSRASALLGSAGS
jgi:hypothetical protein